MTAFTDHNADRARSAAPILSETQTIDIASVRYPGERTFGLVVLGFTFTLLAFLVPIVVYSPQILLALIVIGLAVFLAGKVSFLLAYWQLYGNSVQIGPSQYPEIDEAVRRACKYIGLHRTPTLFVMHGQGLLELFLIKYFTKRGILVFTSELIDTLLASGDSRQLMMVIGRQLGHLRAKHFEYRFLKHTLGQFSFWLYWAWMRRCHLTADRFGYLVAGDLDAARRALLAMTVGKTLAPATDVDAVRKQEEATRSSFFAWLRQVTSVWPYMVRRIMALELFQHLVIHRPKDSTASEALGLLPEAVSVFHITVHGPAIIGEHGMIHVKGDTNVRTEETSVG